MSKPPSSTATKSVPEQKVDKQLWREIQENATGSENQRIEAVRLLFERQGDLPKESKRLIQNLASKEQPVAVRSAIAKQLAAWSLFDTSFDNTLNVLRKDPDQQVKSISEGVQRDRMQLIESISKSLQTTLQSISIPQVDLSKIVIPQVDFSKIIPSLESISLSSSAMIGPLMASRQVLDSIARSVQAALPSYYSQPELEVIGKTYPKLKQSHVTRLRSKLKKCVPGKQSWKAYQDICCEILKYALVPPLLEPSEETATRGRAQRRDLIFQIPYDAGRFWELISITYKSLALIVECKNYADSLRPNQVTITSKYFGEKKLGLLGVIVSRKGLSESAKEEQIRLWMEDGKMILCLTDDDMLNMMSLKEADDNPSKIIDNAIRLFRQSI